MLLAAKRAYDLLRAGRRAYAEWKALPDEQKRAARHEADAVRTLTAELARALSSNAAGRIDRSRERRGREIGAIAADLSAAIGRLKAKLPDPGLRAPRSVRFAARAAARVTPSARPPPEEQVMHTEPPDATNAEPPESFLELEREHASTTRSGLGPEGLFWDVVPETVEWRLLRPGLPLEVMRVRSESIELAWPDGRTEGSMSGPVIYVFTKYDQFCPTGCIEATRDPNVREDGLSVRQLYEQYDVPPLWVGLHRREERRDEGEVVHSFASYVVTGPPAPRPERQPFPRTPTRTGGSLEGTGWIKPPPGVALPGR